MILGGSNIGIYIPHTSSHRRELEIQEPNIKLDTIPWQCLPVPLFLILTHFYHCLVSFLSSAENIMHRQNKTTLKHFQLQKDGKPSRLTALTSALLHSTMLFQFSTISSQKGEQKLLLITPKTK